jgi:hypothetical protein
VLDPAPLAAVPQFFPEPKLPGCGLGIHPFGGRGITNQLTPAQAWAIQAATRLATDASWSDGIVNAVMDRLRLTGDESWTDSQVN